MGPLAHDVVGVGRQQAHAGRSAVFLDRRHAIEPIIHVRHIQGVGPGIRPGDARAVAGQVVLIGDGPARGRGAGQPAQGIPHIGLR